MSNYTQARRPLTITTPLGKDVLLLTGFRGHEAISELFHFAKKVEQYYGTDTSRFEAYSPVYHVNKYSVATFIAWSEFENPLIDVYCAELSFRLAHAKRKAPPTMWLPGHNHISAIAHIGTSDDRLGKAIVDFIRHPR